METKQPQTSSNFSLSIEDPIVEPSSPSSFTSCIKKKSSPTNQELASLTQSFDELMTANNCGFASPYASVSSPTFGASWMWNSDALTNQKEQQISNQEDDESSKFREEYKRRHSSFDKNQAFYPPQSSVADNNNAEEQERVNQGEASSNNSTSVRKRASFDSSGLYSFPKFFQLEDTTSYLTSTTSSNTSIISSTDADTISRARPRAFSSLDTPTTIFTTTPQQPPVPPPVPLNHRYDLQNSKSNSSGSSSSVKLVDNQEKEIDEYKRSTGIAMPGRTRAHSDVSCFLPISTVNTGNNSTTSDFLFSNSAGGIATASASVVESQQNKSYYAPYLNDSMGFQLKEDQQQHSNVSGGLRGRSHSLNTGLMMTAISSTPNLPPPPYTYPQPPGKTPLMLNNSNTSSVNTDFILPPQPPPPPPPMHPMHHHSMQHNNPPSTPNSTHSQLANGTMFIGYPTAQPTNDLAPSQTMLNNTINSSNTANLILSSTGANMWYYEVEFKRFRRNIFLGPPNLQLGDHVTVEADRGQDLGHIVRVSSDMNSFRLGLNKTYGESTVNKRLCQPMKRLLRCASDVELACLARKFEEEAGVLEVCRAKVRQRLLPMKVIDAEYQFDRHKLTFFFEAERRIDFRELVRDLFAVYKTRIWLQQVTNENKKKMDA